jgi:hypothetical protein
VTNLARAVIGLFFAIAMASCASAPVVELPPLPADGPLPMWKIETADGAPAGFLLGTFHALPPAFQFDPRVTTSLAACDQLILEINIANVNEHKDEIAKIAETDGILPADAPGLDTRMSKKSFDVIADYAGELNVPGFVLKRMRPWLAVSLVVGGIAKRAGFDAERSTEKALLDVRGALPVAELESVESQLAMLAALPDDVMLGDFDVEGASGDDPVTGLRSLFSAWRGGDLAKLEDNTFAGLKSDPKQAPLFDKLFFQRNKRMAEQVTAKLAKGERPFVAVGVGHMLGDRGLVALLTAAGYHVTQVGNAKSIAPGPL